MPAVLIVTHPTELVSLLLQNVCGVPPVSDTLPVPVIEGDGGGTDSKDASCDRAVRSSGGGPKATPILVGSQ